MFKMNMLETQLKLRRRMNLQLIWPPHLLTQEEIEKEKYTGLLATQIPTPWINLIMNISPAIKTKANESLIITSPGNLDRTAGIDGVIIGVRSGRTYTGQLVERGIVVGVKIVETLEGLILAIKLIASPRMTINLVTLRVKAMIAFIRWRKWERRIILHPTSVVHFLVTLLKE